MEEEEFKLFKNIIVALYATHVLYVRLKNPSRIPYLHWLQWSVISDYTMTDIHFIRIGATCTLTGVYLWDVCVALYNSKGTDVT